MSDLYFAYGSNMKTERLRERIPNARAIGLATLDGYQFTMNKLGRDASSKANIEPMNDTLVYGVAFLFDPDQWKILDSFEGGYKRITVKIETDKEVNDASTYICIDSRELVRNRAPFGWYLNLILDGAAQHGLPHDYIRNIKTKFRSN